MLQTRFWNDWVSTKQKSDVLYDIEDADIAKQL